MKRLSSLLVVVMLIMIGCSKPESKLLGKWTNSAVKGFVAEFNKDHTGYTSTPIPGHGGMQSTEGKKVPFTWTISTDGKVKITEGETSFYGKLVGKKLEVEINGAISTLEKK